MRIQSVYTLTLSTLLQSTLTPKRNPCESTTDQANPAKSDFVRFVYAFVHSQEMVLYVA